MNFHRISGVAIVAIIFSFAIALVCVSPAAAKKSDKAEPSDDGSKEVGKQQSFKIGARTGSFEAWDIKDLAKFDGVSMEAVIDAVGKEPIGQRKQWGSAFRVLLEGDKPAGSEETPRLILGLAVSRVTRNISTKFIVNGGEWDQDIELSEKKPIAITIEKIDDEYARIKINERSFKVPCNVNIRHIRVVASGLDVSVNNFVLLPPSQARNGT